MQAIILVQNSSLIYSLSFYLNFPSYLQRMSHLMRKLLCDVSEFLQRTVASTELATILLLATVASSNQVTLLLLAKNQYRIFVEKIASSYIQN